jgi:predicted sugar kinase
MTSRPPITAVEITSGARLHFGLLVGGTSDRPRYASVGMMVATPGCSLQVELVGQQDEIVAASTEVRQRLKACLSLCRHAWSVPAVRVTVHAELPRHQGLGSGTQLNLALTAAVAQLIGKTDLGWSQLAAIAGRGRRSVIGACGFLTGGFLMAGPACHEGGLPAAPSALTESTARSSHGDVDRQLGGDPADSFVDNRGNPVEGENNCSQHDTFPHQTEDHRSNPGLVSRGVAASRLSWEDGPPDGITRIPPINHLMPIYRVNTPSDWRIVLITPTRSQGLAGAAEQHAFQQLPPLTDEQFLKRWSRAQHDWLSAWATADFAAASESMYDYGVAVGEYFAPVQGGVFADPRMPELVHRLRSNGVRGVAQTSWGPTIAALCVHSAQASELERQLSHGRWADQCTWQTVEPLNRGARLESKTIPDLDASAADGTMP